MTEDQSSASVASMLVTYRYLVGAVVPIIISGIGVLGRKVARGTGWEVDDFCVGTELTLAGVSGSLVNIAEFLKPDNATFGLLQKKLLGGNLGIALLGFFFYYLSLSLHQDFGPKSGKSRKKQLFFLVGVSNVIGLATLVGALFLMAQ